MDRTEIRRAHQMTAALAALGAVLLVSAPALADIDSYTVGVNGMACPFCAYGIEKKLKGLEGVASLDIHIEKGTVDVSVQEGKTVTPKAIREAVQEAGFELRDLEIRGEATITDADPPEARFTADLSLPVRGDHPDAGERTVHGTVSKKGESWTLSIATTGGGE
ncbi:MAG: heavy-metal-associated domain-containing protein [Bradymonadaceae bacterium]